MRGGGSTNPVAQLTRLSPSAGKEAEQGIAGGAEQVNMSCHSRHT